MSFILNVMIVLMVGWVIVLASIVLAYLLAPDIAMLRRRSRALRQLKQVRYNEERVARAQRIAARTRWI